MRRRAVLGVGVLAAVGAVVRPLPAPKRVAGCAEWGARVPVEEQAVVLRRPERILVHHTATENVLDTSERHAFELARFFQRLHTDDRGWGDTGQHFTISRGGVLLEGRYGSLAALRQGDRLVEGAHCPGQNRTSIGIENEGTYVSEVPPARQWDALVWLCARVCRQYDIPPTEIHGHRDFYADTVCPGDAFYALLPRLRADVALAV
ncbi:peptidoglycan recognition protein family protein [Saccharothrix variisporea]|uniref:N-acetylmuramoyl-L-alanine amidase n=1 Tax=Saccharothrix variisporea TaxID=543527 RepID=A0A495XR11_9PSEU|nr:peptidoglycan recognition family protein [Saccharothrix variisporea]RKT74098.1 N-acetylmuramoyl-L-alanine amidase [Saccharothrix variisporea]